MDLAKVMDAIGDQLDTIAGLRVFRFPPDSLVPPAAVIGYPESLTFDQTYGRGSDRMTLPVWLVVGRASDRGSRDSLAAYCAGSGPASVKAVLESGTYADFGTLRVMSIEFDAVTVSGTEHMAARFDVDIIGKGEA